MQKLLSMVEVAHFDIRLKEYWTELEEILNNTNGTLFKLGQ